MYKNSLYKHSSESYSIRNTFHVFLLKISHTTNIYFTGKNTTSKRLGLAIVECAYALQDKIKIQEF